MKNLLYTLLLTISIIYPFYSSIAQVPQIGAEVWLEPQYTKSHIDTLFKLLADHHMPVARLFMGQGDIDMYDNAFASAEKFSVKIQATLSVPEHPNSEEDLTRYAQYIKRIVSRYKNSTALETWWLINEPGKGNPSTPLEMNIFRQWLEKKYTDINKLNSSWRSRYTSFQEVQYKESWATNTGFSNINVYNDWVKFARYYLIWIQQWIADEIKKEDTLHPYHVNPHAIFSNLILYDLPEWRNFLTSLGASIHPAWHFGILKPDQFAMGIAATCDIIKGASEPKPFWVSELQGGNNTWSGIRPLGPEAEDIAQWTWTSIGCGAEKVIYWLLNNRSNGVESGEWSMLDFQGNPSDRLRMASKVAQTIESEKEFFRGAKPLERKVVILLSPESTDIIARKATKDGLAGRGANAHILSAMSYYQTLSELGIPAIFKYTDDFDWENKTGFLAIFPNAVAVPEKVVKRAEIFVANGNKLIIDGLTGYFDENEVNVLQSGFFFEKMCGATIKEIRTKDNVFKTYINNLTIALPVHLWQTEILNHNAQVIGREGDRITAIKNKYGKGEVVWIPMLAGLGAWLDKNDALAELIANESKSLSAQTPIIFRQKTKNVIIQILRNGDTYLSVITNGNDNEQDVSLTVNKKLIPKIIFNSSPGEIKFFPEKFRLTGKQTIVLKWNSPA
jgi:beta-galactosidase